MDIADDLDDIIGILNKSTSLYSKNQGPDILREENEKKQQDQKNQKQRYQESKTDSLSQFCENQTSQTSSIKSKQQQQIKQQNSLYNALDTQKDQQNINNLSKTNSQQSNYQVQVNQNTNPNRIRYLQFMPWNGKPVENLKPDSGYHFTVINGNTSKTLKGVLESNGFTETNNQNWSIMWSCNTIKAETYGSLMPYQKVNHFPKSIEITRKDLMNRNLSKMQIQYGVANFNFFPKTFILPSEMHVFLDEAEKNKNQWYICKPSGSSQGKGIFITDKPQEIINKAGGGSNQSVVSHYIMNPLLINNLKFDLRIYVVVTSIHPLRIYVYEDGLTRFATQEYNVQKGDQRNKFAHLTNYSINKNAEGFVKNNTSENDGEGNKWSLQALKDFLRVNKVNVDQIFERVDDLIVKTIISIENQICGAFEMQVPFRNNCFQLFGFDVMIDSNFKPWLIEVNLAPSLNGDSPLDLKIKGGLLSDIFTLIGIVPRDQRFTVDTSYNYTSNNVMKDKNYQNILNNMKNVKNGQFNKQQLSNLERYVIKESEDELKRSRNFKRVYPTINAQRYKNYFEVERPFNVLLRNNEFTKQRIPNQPLSLQQMHNNNQSQNQTKQNFNYIQSNMMNTMKDQKQTLRSYNMNTGSQQPQNQQQQKQPLQSYNRKSSLQNSAKNNLTSYKQQYQ